MWAHREEDEDITCWLCGVDLEDSGNSCVEIVGFRLGRVVNIYGIPTTGHWRHVRVVYTRQVHMPHTIEDRGIVEILAELLGIHSRTRDQQTQFRSEPGNVLRGGINDLHKNPVVREMNAHLDQSEENVRT